LEKEKTDPQDIIDNWKAGLSDNQWRVPVLSHNRIPALIDLFEDFKFHGYKNSDIDRRITSKISSACYPVHYKKKEGKRIWQERVTEDIRVARLSVWPIKQRPRNGEKKSTVAKVDVGTAAPPASQSATQSAPQPTVKIMDRSKFESLRKGPLDDSKLHAALGIDDE
jgi:hypothetical protein